MAVSIPLKGSLSADCEKIESLEDLMDEHRILKQLIERLVERGLEVDLAHHLHYAGHEPVIYSTSNAHSGKNQKTLKRKAGKRPLAARGARRRGFAPWIIPKHQAGSRDFGYKIPPPHAGRSPAHGIQAHPAEMHGAEVSLARVSSIGDAFINGLSAD
ncbi:MAG: transposase [Methylosarcina sp.]